jgi:hypothetical protein
LTPARLARVLLIAGASLLVVGVVGRAASNGGEAAAPSPSPSAPPPSETSSPSAEPSPSPTQTVEPSPSETSSPEPAETSAVETPEEFFALFAEAIRTGDVQFLLERLHPVVLERYGARQCRSAVASIANDPDFEAKVRTVSDPGPYEFASDGQSATVEDTLTVGVTFTNANGSSRQDAHVAYVDGVLRWFTDCGDPVG